MGNLKISCTIVLLFIVTNAYGQSYVQSSPSPNGVSAFYSFYADRTSYTASSYSQIRSEFTGVQMNYYRAYVSYNFSSIPSNAVFSSIIITGTGNSSYASEYPKVYYVIDTTAGLMGIGNIIATMTLSSRDIGCPDITSGASNLFNYLKGTVRHLIYVCGNDYNSGSASEYCYYPLTTIKFYYYLPPSIPTLSSPSSGSTNQSVTPTLSWNASSSGTPTISYVLQVSASSSFSTIAYTTTTTSLSATTTTLLNNTLYYWRVYATNAYGTSSYSEVRNFTTIQATATGSDDTPELQSIMGEK